MAAPDLADAGAREIVDLHDFFVRWFRGEVPDTRAVWARVADVLDDGFVLVSPEGEIYDCDTLLSGLRDRHGHHGPASDFTIWTRSAQLRHADETMAVVTYEEWQRRNGKERGRFSTAVFARDPRGPHGLRWLHVHETWLPVHD